MRLLLCGSDYARQTIHRSAMPLVWAHAEYLKLQRSLRDGRVYDLPTQTWDRYVIEQTASQFSFWRFNHKRRMMPQGRTLRLETIVPSLVHWSTDGWRTTHDMRARDRGLGEYVIDLPTETLPARTEIDFTFYWPDVDRWEQTDFRVEVQAADR